MANTALALNTTAIDAVEDEIVSGSGEVVIVDFTRASTPISATAKQIANLAVAKLQAPKKQGGLKDLAGRTDNYSVNPYLLTIEPGLNSRDFKDPANQARIDSLARSIALKGVCEPLTVFYRDGAFVVSHGETRLLAAYRAIEVYGSKKAAEVPVKLEARNVTRKDIVSRQLTGNDSKPLNAFEQATAFQKLTDLDMPRDEIASLAGISAMRVGQLLALGSNATPEIKALVNSGKVSASMAFHTLRDKKGDGEAAFETLTAAVKNAAAAGRERASPKHAPKKTVAAYKVNRSEVAAIIKTGLVKKSPGHVNIRLTEAAYAELVEMLALVG